MQDTDTTDGQLGAFRCSDPCSVFFRACPFHPCIFFNVAMASSIAGDMPMRLEGSRCAVRPWQLSDADAVVRHANNANVARQLRDRFPHPYSRANAMAFLKAALSSADESNLAIEVDGEAAGAIGYVTGTDVERYSAEIGYWLGEAQWGRGIVTEALILVTEHVFATAGVLRLFALPFVDNTGSIRVLEKAGYVREGILKCSSVKYGKPRDQAIYARINPDWRGIA